MPVRRKARAEGRWVGLLLLLAGLVLPLCLPAAPRKPMPQAMVAAAQSLVGRVGYFWGGKSSRLGYDPRWGLLTRVDSPGSDTTGLLLPYGLDCSGLVSWAAVNAAGTKAAYRRVGEGVRAQFAACKGVDWDDIRPGDLLFFPDLSHVGIAVERGADGRVAVVHSSKTLGGVVRSEDAAAIGFALAGRPAVYERFTSVSG